MTCPNCTHVTELQHVCEHCGHRIAAGDLLPDEHFQQRENCSKCGDPVDKEPGGLCVDCAYTATYAAEGNWKLCQDLRAENAKLRAELDGYKRYAAVNPLGGPASLLDAAADRIRAGEDFYAVMRDVGFYSKDEVEPMRAQLGALARAAIAYADDATNPLFGPEAREKRGERLREMAEKAISEESETCETHQWKWHRNPNTPDSFGESVRYCDVCGIEDEGD